MITVIIFHYIQGNLKGARLTAVKNAFKKADKDKSGKFDMKDMKGSYNVKSHPKYVNGELTEAQIFKMFIANYEPDENNRDGVVTEEEFINYYAGVSASIDNDGYFCLMVNNSWN